MEAQQCAATKVPKVRLELEDQLFTKIENWRRGRPKIPSRSEAVRQLLEQALTAAQKQS
jgi:metal-responsive CopG/Arc/MetJ family transcriptional regulator